MEGAHIIYNSVGSITNTGPVEFLVPGDNECSFILNQTRLSGHFVVTNDDGGLVTNESNAMVNHFAACLFSQVEVYLNGVQVADLSSAVTYPWRMFLQSYLNCNIDVKDTYLTAEGYYTENEDEVGTIKIPTQIESRLLKKEKVDFEQ